MQLIDYGAQDRYLMGYDYSRRFKPGKEVSFTDYLYYIEETIFCEIMLQVMIRNWERNKARTMLLLKRKFETVTGTRWKQFPGVVFSFLDYPEKPTIVTIDSFDFYAIKQWEKNKAQSMLLLKRKFEKETGTRWKQFPQMVFNFIPYPGKQTIIRQFVLTNMHYITREQIRKCLHNEPVIGIRFEEAFITYIMYFYQKGKQEYSFHVPLISTNGQITFFQKVYRRCTNFTIEVVETAQKQRQIEFPKGSQQQRKPKNVNRNNKHRKENKK